MIIFRSRARNNHKDFSHQQHLRLLSFFKFGTFVAVMSQRQ